MSNSLVQSPLVIDTVANDIMERPIFIETIRWIGATDAAHTAVITDQNDRTIWASKAAAALEPEESVINQWFNGANVTVLGSGKLYIYFH